MATTTDIAKRVYDHTWKLDPIVRSLLDTDFYKLLMLQMIWGLYKDRRVTFSLLNRTPKVRLADEIDEAELRDQLDHARSLRLSKKESIWLAGNTFYGQRHIFSADFLEWFDGFALPAYDLRKEDGQYVLSFEGPWAETTMWEIPPSPSSTSCARARLSGTSAGSNSMYCMRGPRPGCGPRSSGCGRCPGSVFLISAPAAVTASCGRAGAWKR